MKTQETQKYIDQMVGTDGIFRIQSWWMHKILSDLNSNNAQTIKELNKKIIDLTTRIEALEQGSSANVTDNTLAAEANVSNGVMSVNGSVIDGILKL